MATLVPKERRPRKRALPDPTIRPLNQGARMPEKRDQKSQLQVWLQVNNSTAGSWVRVPVGTIGSASSGRFSPLSSISR